ncbi:MAG: solute-binding protein [Desulfobacteraceae bacterium]|nr:solute-binding protein [Desulfobacteraceae bacterium]MBC2720574.1 substrate-binding domain-containing protein [Desulfobacteraceae bacterium]
MKKNNLILKVILSLIAILLIYGVALGEDKIINMATTTSTQASGLLDVLLPELEKDTGIRVKVFAKGTGAAIRDGIDGNVDVIFVHAKKREEEFVKQSYGIKRYAVMHNDFVILGPSDDPAGIRGQSNAAAALAGIAKAEALFISRGDDSGTHTKEQALWKIAGVSLEVRKTEILKKGKKTEICFVFPESSMAWYISIGQGMGKTIIFADEKQAYTLSDRGTYIKYNYGRKESIDLEIMCEGDSFLNNPYGVIPVNPDRHPHVKYELAEKFANWLISPKAQSLIANYRLMGNQLFYPWNF